MVSQPEMRLSTVLNTLCMSALIEQVEPKITASKLGILGTQSPVGAVHWNVWRHGRDTTFDRI